MTALSVKVLALDERDGPKGDHVWLQVEFSGGVIVNIRLDEFTDSTVSDWSPQLQVKTGRGSGFTRVTEVTL